MNHMPTDPIRVTLQLNESLQEVIELHEGDDIQRVAAEFCAKYGIASAVQVQIVEEFKRQIRECFGEASLDSYLKKPPRDTREGELKASLGPKEELKSSKGSFRTRERVPSSANPYKDSQFVPGPAKSNPKKDVPALHESKGPQVQPDPDSPTQRLKKFLRAKEEARRSSAGDRANQVSFPPIDDYSNKPDPRDSPGPFSPAKQQPDGQANGSNEEDSQKQNKQCPFASLLNRNNFNTNKTPAKEHRFFNEDDRVSNITPINRTDNISDVQSYLNIDKDLAVDDPYDRDSFDLNDEGRLKDIFENSGYFKRTSKNEQQDRPEKRDSQEPSRSSYQGSSNRAKPAPQKKKERSESKNNSVSFSNRASPLKQQRISEQLEADPVSARPAQEAKKPAQDQHIFETSKQPDAPPTGETRLLFTHPHQKLFEDDFGYDANEEASEMKETVPPAYPVRRHLQKVQVEGAEAIARRESDERRKAGPEKSEETARQTDQQAPTPGRRRAEHVPQARERTEAHRGARPALKKRRHFRQETLDPHLREEQRTKQRPAQREQNQTGRQSS